MEKREKFMKGLRAEIDSNISDIIRNQEIATEILKKPLSKESQEEVERRLQAIMPFLEEDIEL